MIEVKNLVKKYGDHIAVDHLSFTVEEGHIYGFLGHNDEYDYRLYRTDRRQHYDQRA